MDRVDLTELEALHRAATPRAPYYAHPESDAAKATAALDAAVRAASPALLARLRALEEVARAAEAVLLYDGDRDLVTLAGCPIDEGTGPFARLRAALAAAKEGA